MSSFIRQIKRQKKASVLLTWKKENTALTVLRFRNSINFKIVDTPEINKNAITPKVNSCKKRPTFQSRQERKQTIKVKQTSPK